jgi:hypothetical protein
VNRKKRIILTVTQNELWYDANQIANASWMILPYGLHAKASFRGGSAIISGEEMLLSRGNYMPKSISEDDLP